MSDFDFDLTELKRVHDREQERADVLAYFEEYREPSDDARVFEAIEFSGAEWKQIRDAAEEYGISIPQMIRRFIAEGLDNA